MNENESDFLTAAFNGNLDSVNQLIAAGVNIDVIHDQWDATALYLAAQNGHTEIVHALIDAGATIDSATSDGATPLYIAAQNGHTEIVLALIGAHASVDAAAHDGFTPLYVAARLGYKEMVHSLLDAGATIDAAAHDGFTPLHTAAEKGHKEVVHALIDAGATIDSAAHDGATPLHVAAQNGHTAIVTQLLDKSATINATTNKQTTPLYFAAQNGHKEIVLALIDAGANIDAATHHGVTPFYIAAQNGHTEIAKALIDAGANIDAATHHGFTPLYIAAQNGHKEIVKAIISDVSAKRLELALFQGLANYKDDNRKEFANLRYFLRRVKLANTKETYDQLAKSIVKLNDCAEKHGLAIEMDALTTIIQQAYSGHYDGKLAQHDNTDRLAAELILESLAPTASSKLMYNEILDLCKDSEFILGSFIFGTSTLRTLLIDEIKQALNEFTELQTGSAINLNFLLESIKEDLVSLKEQMRLIEEDTDSKISIKSTNCATVIATYSDHSADNIMTTEKSYSVVPKKNMPSFDLPAACGAGKEELVPTLLSTEGILSTASEDPLSSHATQTFIIGMPRLPSTPFLLSSHQFKENFSTEPQTSASPA